VISKRRTVVCWTASIILCACLSSAREPDSKPLSQTRPAPPQPQTFLQMEASKLEDDLASMMERRIDAPPSAAPELDLQIDLRIIADRMLSGAARSSPESELASCGYLRAQEVLSIPGQVQQQLPKGAQPAPSQLAALSKIHRMSYQIAEFKTVGQLDETCKELGTILLVFGRGLPASSTLLPLMRPISIEAASSRASEPKTLADLSAAARQAAVAPALRRELIALADATASASADGKRHDETSALYSMLVRSIDLARGLQQGSLIDPDARAKIQTQLTGGLALFLDPRTRAAGSAKIELLGRYQQMLDNVGKLNLSPQLRDRLAPVFGWAQSHVDQGPGLMDTIERYLQLCARHDAQMPPALPPTQKKVLESMQKDFAAQRRTFLADAVSLGDGGVGTSGSTMTRQLRVHLDTLENLETTLQLIDQTPEAPAALAPFKPHPTSGLDRRAMVAISAIGEIVQTPTPAQGRSFLSDLQTLGRLARQISNSAPVPAEINRVYAGGKFAQFNILRSTMLTDLASQAAAGKEIDREALERLVSAQKIADALAEATAVESVLKQSDILRRWADWKISAETLSAATHDYREATSRAFDAFVGSEPSAITQWTPIHARIQPLLVMIKNDGMYIEQCKTFPTGWAGDVARLLTPMDQQPFGRERYASVMLAAWGQSMENPESSDAAAILNTLTERLTRELHP
jgi:hypothetical protein